MPMVTEKKKKSFPVLITLVGGWSESWFDLQEQKKTASTCWLIFNTLQPCKHTYNKTLLPAKNTG